MSFMIYDSYLLHGELDGWVRDEHERGLGAIPQGCDALLNPDLSKAVKKSPVPVDWVAEILSFLWEISYSCVQDLSDFID